MPLSDRHGFGPFYLETSRDKRLETFARLRHWFKEEGKDQNLPTGQYPWYAIEPWYEEPDPPWPRCPITLPMNEIFHNSEQNYTVLYMMITDHVPTVMTYDNRSDEQREASSSSSSTGRNPEFDRRSKLWSKNHPNLHEELKHAEIVGLQGQVERDGIKFLVFRTAEIPHDVLVRFLDTTDQPDPRTETFRTFTPFSYLFVDSESDSSSGATVKEFSGSGATRPQNLPHLPESTFLNATEELVQSAWERLVEPLTNTRSLISTHVFIVLDEHTAEPGNDTVRVIQPAPEEEIGGYYYNSARVSFDALNAGVLKAFEMLFLHVDMLPADEGGVIRGRVYGV